LRARVSALGRHFVLVLTSTLVALLIAEGICRILIPAWSPPTADRRFWTHDELLGWAHRPHHEGDFEHPDFSVKVAINSDGLRDREYERTRVSQKKRVLVLGDSFAWGFGVDRKGIFCEILEDRYPDTEFINAGVSGYGTDQQLLYYRERGAFYRPDVVLVLFHENDIVNNCHPHQYNYNKPRFVIRDGELVLTNVPVPNPTLRQRALAWIFARTHFVRMLTAVSREVWWRMTDSGSVETPQEDDPGMATTRMLFLRLKEAVERDGARLVVVTVPAEEATRLFMGKTLAEAEIPHLALDDAFAAASEPLYFENDDHWNPAGHRIVAATTEGFLLDLGILP
jgi:hypothetical protein